MWQSLLSFRSCRFVRNLHESDGCVQWTCHMQEAYNILTGRSFKVLVTVQWSCGLYVMWENRDKSSAVSTQTLEKD